MFNKADILARLQDGDTVDQIADELAGAINEAQAEYKEIQEQEKIDKEAARVKDAKRQAVLGMIDCFCDYAVAAGGYEDFLDELQKVDVDKIVESIDSMLGMVKLLGALDNLEFAAPAKTKKNTAFNADDVLSNFLKSI